MLGHPTWAHYAMELKMAGTPERVRRFYEELCHRSPGRCGASWIGWPSGSPPTDTKDRSWPGTGATTTMPAPHRVRRRPGSDQRVLPARPDHRGHVRDHAARCWASSTASSPRRMPGTNRCGSTRSCDKATGRPLAHFYADLFPREGKFGHAAAWPLVVGHRAADGEYVAPVSAIVANFTPPSGDRPSLLRHSEV